MKQSVDLAVLTRKIKTQLEDKGRRFIYCNELPDGVVIGMESGDIIIGTKKERTAATDVLSAIN